MTPSTPTNAQYKDLHVLMDVVDTVRHAQEDARRVAGAVADEESLIQQVLQVYHSQGIAVDEATVREGMALLKERRFEFVPPTPGLSTRLARVYVTRSKWGRKAGAVVVGLAFVLGFGNLAFTYQEHRQESAWMVLAESSENDERRIRHQHEVLTERAMDLEAGGSHAKAREMAIEALAILNTLGEQMASLPPLPSTKGDLESFYANDTDSARALTDTRRGILQDAFSALSLAVDSVGEASVLHDLGMPKDSFDIAAATDLDGFRESQRLRFEDAMQAGDSRRAREAVDSWGEAVALDGLYQVIQGRAHALGGPSQAVMEGMLHEARTPLVAGNLQVARSLLEGAESAVEVLPISYELRIVNEEGAQSGIWRYYGNDRSRRSYFIVVDALDAAGSPITLSVRDVEDGRMVRTSRFAIRVPEAVYNAVGEDKTSDGIIDQPIFGTKKAGELEPSYEYETFGGILVDW